jgi:beta-galactosidase
MYSLSNEKNATIV